MSDWLPSKVLQILALDLGLLILAGWFFILLLIIREFRQFAQKVTSNAPDDKMLSMCQKALDEAMSFAKNNEDTLSDLIRVQQALEAQLSDIRESTQDHVSPEEQKLINELNQKLERSHKLIRKLKGDLDVSAKRLRATKEKLFGQYDTVNQLRKEKEQLEQKAMHLERELFQVSKSGNIKEITREHQVERQNLLATISQYKRQIEEQDNAIRQLLEQGSEAGGGNSAEMRKALGEAQNQIKNLTKEKDFIESKFLDLLKQTEKD